MYYVDELEFKKNVDIYLEKSQTEDVYITRGKEVVSVLMSRQAHALLEADAFIHTLKIDKDDNRSDDEVLAEELIKKHLK